MFAAVVFARLAVETGQEVTRAPRKYNVDLGFAPTQLRKSRVPSEANARDVLEREREHVSPSKRAQKLFDDDAAESPEVRQMEGQALATGTQPRGKTAKVGAWIILAILGLCLIVALVVIVAKVLH